MNLTNDFKRVISGMLSVAMTATLVQSFPAIAEDAQITKYPYAVFASSDIEGAITVNAGNFCVNGNVATNGTIVASGNMNINGTKTENAGEDMIYIFDKIDSAYFSKSNVNEYSDDYILEEMNINITTPTEIMGEATLTGNININTALKAFENVNLYGEVKNTNDSVIFSKYGDIVIDSQNVNLNGLVYAPFGNVVVTAQNLNLNNVVIIADTITFNCPNVNANYSSSAAEFVGTVSDLLDIPYDEWQYMKDENENDFPDFFEDFDNWFKLKDTDGDKLPDCVEQYIGSDSALVDTDGDALDDFYELFVTYTEPAKDDTDDNGILDCDEDFDKDDLSNLEEYLASTSPWDDDTDSDTLKDGEEIDTYGTDPLKPDTDDDGLEDCDEIHLGTDPVNPDTDSDGILDGDEKFYQTYTHIVENEDCVVSEVIVSLEGTGNLQKNTTVKSVMNKDVLCTNVAGLVGEPFNIETSSQFDTATITFKIDQSKLGDTEFDNLMFLWYDEENNEFIELETVLDEPNSTVSVVTTHFSKYMIVDRQAWYDAWALEFNYERKYDNSGVPLKIYNTVLAIDCSGSMSDYDRNGTIRKEAATGFINIMNPNDKTALMFFDSTVDRFHVLTSDKDALLRLLDRMYTSGGTDFDVALQSAIALLEDEIGKPNVINRIIFMTDGQDSLSTNVLDVAKDNNIMIYTIGFSTNTSDSNLQYYADYTGGEFYKAYNADELIEIYENIALSSDFDTTDTDGDGLFDVVEIAGMRMQNGYVGGENGAPLTTDPTNPDTDGDGLLDGEEIDQTISWKRVINDTGDGSHGTYCIYFNMLSDPTKVDTDGDGLLDGRAQYCNDQMVVPVDKYPLDVNGIPSVWKQYTCDMMSENIPSTLCEYYECDVNSNSLKELSDNINFDDLDVNDYDSVYNFFKNIIKSSLFTDIGSKFLMFRLDDGGTVLHSQTNKDIYDYVMQRASEELNALEYAVFEEAVDKLNIDSLFETWQKPFGYDNLFDEVFRLGTNDNMDSEKIVFEDSQGDDFVLWIWRGDYLNLGAGAEMGLYKKNKFLEKVDIEHWDSVDFEIPMKLSLYNYTNDNVDTVFNWNPINDQWWITGFNPECMDVDVKEQVLVGSVDMSYDVEMYNSIVSTVTSEGNNNKYKEVVYYDDTTHTIWIMWGEANE